MGGIIDGIVGGIWSGISGTVTGFVDGLIAVGSDILSFMQPVVDWLANITLDQKIILVITLWVFWTALVKEIVARIIKIVFLPIDLPLAWLKGWLTHGQKIRMQNRSNRRQERRRKRKEKYAALKAKQEEAKQKLKEKREREKYATVNLKNKLLLRIISNKKIFVWGGVGKGKTLFSSMLIDFILSYCEEQDKKTARKEELREIEGRTVQVQKLAEKGYCPIYSDKTVERKGLKSQELEPLMMQQKVGVVRCVYFMDDATKWYPITMYQTMDVEKRIVVEDTADRHRHYDDSWMVGNAPSPERIFVGIRDKDWMEIKVKESWVAITDTGGAKLRRYNAWLNMAPAWFTGKTKQSFQEHYRRIGFIKQLFLNFAPLQAAQELVYYNKQEEYYSKIKDKYLKFHVLIEINGKEHMVQFGNKQKIAIQSRHFGIEHRKKFDKEGNRIHGRKVSAVA